MVLVFHFPVADTYALCTCNMWFSHSTAYTPMFPPEEALPLNIGAADG